MKPVVRPRLLLAALGLLLLLAVWLSLALGPVSLPLGETLRAGLRQLGIADNTMLWFSSDNGGWLDPKKPGAHGTNAASAASAVLPSLADAVTEPTRLFMNSP